MKAINKVVKPLAFIGLGFCILMCLQACSPSKEVRWNQLPPALSGGSSYKVEPYIEAASILQSMGRERACSYMMKFAEKDRDSDRLFILCRMLFVKRASADFRGAYLGKPVFYGDTTNTDWPLAPITLVDGIPFKIVFGYTCYGAPELQEQYLEYCITNCDWNTERYEMKTTNALSVGLDKLLKSPIWKRALEQDEIKDLSQQIN